MVYSCAYRRDVAMARVSFTCTRVAIKIDLLSWQHTRRMRNVLPLEGRKAARQTPEKCATIKLYAFLGNRWCYCSFSWSANA